MVYINNSRGDSELADWNMAKATMIRMDSIMREMYKAYITNNGISYYKNIMALHREVYSELNSTERAKALELMNKCTDAKNKLTNSPRETPNSPTLISSLVNFELFLRDCMGKHDLLIPHKDDPRNIGRRGRY